MNESFVHSWESGAIAHFGSSYYGSQQLSPGPSQILKGAVVYTEAIVLAATGRVVELGSGSFTVLLDHLGGVGGLVQRPVMTLAGALAMAAAGGSTLAAILQGRSGLTIDSSTRLVASIESSLAATLRIAAAESMTESAQATIAASLLMADALDIRVDGGRLLEEAATLSASSAIQAALNAAALEIARLRAGAADSLAIAGTVSTSALIGLRGALLSETSSLLGELCALGVEPRAAASIVGVFELAALFGVEGLITEAARRYPGIDGMLCVSDETSRSARLGSPTIRSASLANARILC